MRSLALSIALAFGGCSAAVHQSGSISGTIALDSRPGARFGHAVKGSSVFVNAVLANSVERDVVGIGTVGEVKTDAHGYREVAYIISDLPLDTPLLVSVKPTAQVSPQYSELGGGFSTVVTFRSGEGLRPIELTAAKKTHHLDFLPVDLEIISPNSPPLRKAPKWQTP